ncbi:hypothetical protein Hanom_Chr09g00802931 [Helianthus anomalus]
MLKIPSPKAMSLSTPQLSPQISPTILPLFKAIDIQIHSSPSHEHITESITPTMTVSDPLQYAIPQTVGEATPLEFYETLAGSSSGATTTNVESIDLHLDFSFISKTPLKATTVSSNLCSCGKSLEPRKWGICF